MISVCSGGSRISQWGGAALTNYLAYFCRKLRENEKNMEGGRGGTSLALPRSATGMDFTLGQGRFLPAAKFSFSIKA